MRFKKKAQTPEIGDVVMKKPETGVSEEGVVVGKDVTRRTLKIRTPRGEEKEVSQDYVVLKKSVIDVSLLKETTGYGDVYSLISYHLNRVSDMIYKYLLEENLDPIDSLSYIESLLTNYLLGHLYSVEGEVNEDIVIEGIIESLKRVKFSLSEPKEISVIDRVISDYMLNSDKYKLEKFSSVRKFSVLERVSEEEVSKKLAKNLLWLFARSRNGKIRVYLEEGRRGEEDVYYIIDETFPPAIYYKTTVLKDVVNYIEEKG